MKPALVVDNLPDPPVADMLRLALIQHDIALSAAAEAEAEVKRLVRVSAAEKGLTFIRVEAARREVMAGDNAKPLPSWFGKR